MAEYVEREALATEILGLTIIDLTVAQYADAVLLCLKDAPAADVAPVVHGKWADKPTGRYRQMQSWCSACGRNSGIGGIKSNQHKPYCPNCGAKMDL